MLKVKNLTLLTKKIEKKAGILTTVAKKRALVDFILQLSVAFWLDYNQKFALYRMRPIINRVMAIFSPKPLKKLFFLFFVKVPPPQEES